MDKMEWKRLKVENESGIVTVTLNRPEKMNALDMDLFQELDVVSKQLKQQKGVRAVIVNGAGGNFSSGLDVKSMVTSKKKAMSLLAKWLPGNANLAQRVSKNWRELPFPVIAVIEGKCYGGGMQIALGADFRFVTPDCELSIMEIRWGLVPDMAGLLSLREVVSKDVALKLTMSGDIVSGNAAKTLSLVTEVSHNPMQDAKAFCQKLSNGSPDALAAIKKTTNRCWNRSERYLFAHETYSQIRLLLGRNFAIAGKRQRNKSEVDYQDRQSFW
ncbi:crotonase/enoyl-CoA hydratase family protein [Photobacterium minamisatsumaniensis]|uniref:crotonase/enoyl-CoA hydratase family protein n=1 Tax=Photobacterium minamisatsumaniensis TaxID=2910233 RepID=UPI003D0B6AC3